MAAHTDEQFQQFLKTLTATNQSLDFMVKANGTTYLIETNFYSSGCSLGNIHSIVSTFAFQTYRHGLGPRV